MLHLWKTSDRRIFFTVYSWNFMVLEWPLYPLGKPLIFFQEEKSSVVRCWSTLEARLFISYFSLIGCVWNPCPVISTINSWPWVHQKSSVVSSVRWDRESPRKWNKAQRVVYSDLLFSSFNNESNFRVSRLFNIRVADTMPSPTSLCPFLDPTSCLPAHLPAFLPPLLPSGLLAFQPFHLPAFPPPAFPPFASYLPKSLFLPSIS